MVYTSIKTPGVYVNEVSIFPPSVAQVPTAIPAFIGYTEWAEETNGESLTMKYKKISSMVEFELYFGKGPQLVFDVAAGYAVELDANAQVVKAENKLLYYLYYSMQLFYANGGGDCYIISVGDYNETIAYGTISTGMRGGLEVVNEIDEPTMLVFPDAVSLSPAADLYKLQQDALSQSAALMDRVGIFDIVKAKDKTELNNKVQEFRDNIGMNNLKYGAAYAPWLKVNLKKEVHFRDIKNKIVKAGSNILIDLKSLVAGYSVADGDAIKKLIDDLGQVTADNDKMQTIINTALSSSATKADGFTGTPTSLDAAFDMVVQSVYTKVAAAEAESVAATKTTKTNQAAAEMKKLVLQLFNLAVFLDDFGFIDAAYMSSKELVAFTYSTLGFSPIPAVTPPAQNPSSAVGAQLKKLTDWNAEMIAASKVFSDPVQTTALPSVTFETYNLPAGVAAMAAPANDAARLVNIRTAVDSFKDLYTFLSNMVKSIQAYGKSLEKTKEDALLKIWPVYKNIVDSINNNLTILPPSGAIAGIYARVDNDRGVWKAPANVSINYATGTLVNITDNIQDGLNVDVNAGKSVNAIRVFAGKGTMVWGARTLAGNDNEWRYISVRRFFNMVEESVKKSTSWAVFEPNDANTWVKVKSMIENYLVLLWRQGALAGAKPDEAFFVEVGLNKTMTFVDILEGRMIVKIGMAVVRPAEFIILEFSHKVQTS
jgi:phage tail sheath protein FI